jgi:hypothetical protein
MNKITLSTRERWPLDGPLFVEIVHQSLNKHLPGKHEQKDHGHGEGTAEDEFDRKDVTEGLLGEAYTNWADLYTDQLNLRQLEAVNEYVGGNYDMLNAYYRQRKPEFYYTPEADPEYIERISEGLDSIFSRPESQLPENVLLFRGLGFGEDDAERSLFLGMQPGEIFEDKSYFSSSMSHSVARSFAFNKGDFPLVLEIEAPRGTQAIPLSRWGYNVGESEVLLPRSSKFQVISNEKVSAHEVEYNHIRVRILS